MAWFNFLRIKEKPKHKVIKIVSILTKGELAYLSPKSFTSKGLRIFTKPFIIVNWAHLTITEKYQLVLELLERSQIDIPMPVDMEAYGKEVLSSFGFKTWESFDKGGHNCNISLFVDTMKFEFSPSHYDGRGFIGSKSETETISSDAPQEQIIEALERVMANCS